MFSYVLLTSSSNSKFYIKFQQGVTIKLKESFPLFKIIFPLLHAQTLQEIIQNLVPTEMLTEETLSGPLK